MVSKKGKRKIIVDGREYFWFVRKNAQGIPRVHIISPDKKYIRQFPMLDSEVPVTPSDIEQMIKKDIG